MNVESILKEEYWQAARHAPGGFRWRMVKKILSVLLAGGALFLVHGADPTAERRERIRKLENSLLAPCCYSEVVARHNSEAAVKMRLEIAARVAEGKTDREILDAYKRLYGLRVLSEPEGAAWWWSNLVPWFALALGTILAVRILRNWLHPRPAPPAALAHAEVSMPDMEDL